MARKHPISARNANEYGGGGTSSPPLLTYLNSEPIMTNRVWPRLSRWMTLCFAVGAVWFGAETAHAAALSGRAAIWSYMREDTVRRTQIVPLLSLTVYQIGHPALSLETTLRGFTDLHNGENTDNSIRIHRLLLRYKPERSPWELRCGQQWINEGVGRGNVAGLWGRYAFSRVTSLTAYAGWRLPTSVSLDETVPNEGFSAGFNARAKTHWTQLALSYFYVFRGSTVLFQGVGLDGIAKPTPDLSLRGRLHMNIEQSVVETAEFAAQWQARSNLLISAIARSHVPRVFEDSFFARFLEDAGTSSARASARWNFYRYIYGTGAGTAVFAENKVLYKVTAGVGIPQIEVGYTHWLSVADGDMDGFYGQAFYKLNQMFDFKAGFDYSRGSNSEVRPNTECQSAWLGGNWSPVRAFSLGVRGEHIRDRLYSDDWRVLLSIASSFSTLMRESER
jgi:hypothetical protein